MKSSSHSFGKTLRRLCLSGGVFGFLVFSACGGYSGSGKLLPPEAHRDIRIVGNRISGSPRGVLVEGCTGVTVADNVLETPTGGASGLVVTQSVDVIARDNACRRASNE